MLVLIIMLGLMLAIAIVTVIQEFGPFPEPKRFKCPECGSRIEYASCLGERNGEHEALFHCQNCLSDWDVIYTRDMKIIKIERKFWG